MTMAAVATDSRAEPRIRHVHEKRIGVHGSPGRRLVGLLREHWRFLLGALLLLPLAYWWKRRGKLPTDQA
ncbi:hypothetical protein [Roseateles violae]|uniref:Uncharacterized protein n=1 Tax=Roseateles violae TaxID=3058042 RepID=A0ABT8DTJ1_9BURK|nr:hypothetical protein [Pelomonas sp. PFR6]MDN3920209.1 hypothetical protein [Pelomonas sp. PFR6]